MPGRWEDGRADPPAEDDEGEGVVYEYLGYDVDDACGDSVAFADEGSGASRWVYTSISYLKGVLITQYP